MQPLESRRAVARASAIMFVAITLGRVLGFVRDAAITHLYGQKGITDVFNVAFIIPDLLFYLIAGGALTAAFIPVFTDYLTRGQEDDAWEVFSTLATFLTVVIAVLVVLGEIYAVPLSRLLLYNPKYKPEDVALCARLMRILLPAQVCFFLGGLMMGTLQSRQHFVAPAAGPLVYNAAVIAGGIALAGRHDISGFSWGALVGAVIGNVFLQIAVLRRMGVRYRPSWNLGHPGVRRVGGMMAAVTLSLALPQILMSINRMFGTQLSFGVVSALQYTNRLMQAPLGMFGQALAVALLPTLAAHAALNDIGEFRETLSQSLRAILFVTVPLSVLMIALSTPIVRMVFQHGVYTAQDTAVAAPILAVYCTALAAWSVQAIVARACFALGDNRTPVLAGLGVTVLFVVLNLALVRPLGGNGLAAATSLSGLAIAAVMAEVLRRQLGGLGGREIVGTLGKTLLASAPMAAGAWAVAHVIERRADAFVAAGHHLPAAAAGLAECAAGSAVGMALFAGMALLLRMPEAGVVWQRIRRGKSRSSEVAE